MFSRIGIACLLACCVACVADVTDTTDDNHTITDVSDLQSELRPSGKGVTNKSFQATNNGGGMIYHGGPVLLGNTNVYYIWYGNWAGNTATTILTDLATNIGGSPYFGINTTYYNGAGVHVSNAVTYAGSMVDAYSRGTNLSDADVGAVVSNALSSHALPSDLNGVYFVLTSADVHETSGFCRYYCGYHSYNAAHIKYAFVGNPDQCPSGCAEQTVVSPNNNVGADGMASIIAHELEESVTDPLLSAWFDRRGSENADRCAWTFGATYIAGNTSRANMHLGSRDFLIQQNWVNLGTGYCALHL